MAAQRQFLELPLEVLDLILSYTFEWPQDSLAEYDPQACQDMTTNLFRSPVSLACKNLRQRYLEILSSKSIWIRAQLPIPSVETRRPSVENLANIIKCQLPAVRPYQLSQLSQVNMVQLRRGNPDIEDQTSGIFTTFMYTFKAFAAIVHFIYILSDYNSTKLTVSTTGTSSSLIEILRSKIVPAVLLGAGMRPRSLVFNLPDEAQLSEKNIRRFSAEPTSIRDFLWLIQENLRFANSLETKNHMDAAKIWLLHSCWLIWEARKYLPSPNSWHDGETDPSERISRQGVPGEYQHLGRNVFGNEARYCLHEMNFRASQAFVTFYEAFGAVWVEQHDMLYHLMTPRIYSEVPMLSLFSLSTKEIAEFEYARAITDRVIQSIENRRKYCQQNFADPLWYQRGALYDPRLNPLWARALLSAYLMEPNNAKFKAAAENAMDCFGDEEDREGIGQWAMDRLDRVDEIRGIRVNWIGPRYILNTFGDVDVLRYLPLARKRLEH